MKLSEMIRAVQEEIGVEADGLAGPQTWGELYRRRKQLASWEGEAPAEPVGTPGSAGASPSHAALSDISAVDARSEKAIQTLLPEVRPYARALVHLAADEGVKLIVTSGTRTYAEQDALYAQGRTAPGMRVTNAAGGQSNHNFGIAFDVTVFYGDAPVYEGAVYKAIGAWGKSIGLSWGGDWRTFQDEPHFELRPAWAKDQDEAVMLAGLRSRHDNHQPIFA